MADTSSLPDPDHAALERSRLLTARIHDAIRDAGGALGFDAYMAMALYTPRLGYYAGDGVIFGRQGDFVTAPEAGSLFAACLARQCAEVLGSDDGIVEYGGGSGRLACDLLGLLADSGHTPRDYCIVEPSASLRERQQANCAQLPVHLRARLHWCDEHPPAGSRGVVIANEVLDAMPATRCVVQDGRWHELMVTLDGDQLAWSTRPYAGTTLDPAWAAHLPDGYLTETHAGFATWFASLRKRLSRALVLLADYGYPRHEFLHPSRSAGTLQCHYQHLVHDDPLFHPGLQDITASVDFTAVAEQAFDAGFDILGYTTQAHFLIDCGLEEILAAAPADETARYRLAQQAKLLLMPGSMGQTFKVMALGVGEQPALRGFGHDERHRLDGFTR